MKRHPLYAACSALVVALSVYGNASAAEAIISNLGEVESVTKILTDATGAPLPVGCFAQLAHFPGMSAEEISTLATSGLDSLLAAATRFGDASAIGVGAELPGHLEFQASEALAAALSSLHLIVANAADPAVATQFMLLRISGVIPADEITGPDTHTTFHLAGAAVVHGTSNPSTFATAPLTPAAGYGGWVSLHLGAGYTAEDRLPDADPDGDGRVNLLEYATGTSPADGSQIDCLKVRRDSTGQVEALFLRRTGLSGISYHLDFRPHPGEGAWAELTSPVTVSAAPPASAPQGFEWARQALPSGPLGFARLRVEMAP